jgi:hypothetical protein
VAEQEVMAANGVGVDEGGIRVGVGDCCTTVTASDAGGLCQLKVVDMNSESKARNKSNPPETIWMRH